MGPGIKVNDGKILSPADLSSIDKTVNEARRHAWWTTMPLPWTGLKTLFEGSAYEGVIAEPLGRIIRCKEYKVDPRIRVCNWDFDLTYTNAEQLHRRACEFGAEELFRLAAHIISHDVWRRKFQPAFGKPTDETNRVIVSTFAEISMDKNHDMHKLVPGVYENFLKVHAELLKGHPTACKTSADETSDFRHSLPIVANLLGELRKEVFQLFIEVAKRQETREELPSPHRIIRLSVDGDTKLHDEAIDEIIKNRIPPGETRDKLGFTADEIRARKRQQIEELKSITLKTMPFALEAVEAGNARREIQNIVSSSDAWILEGLLGKFGTRGQFLVVTGADHVASHERKPMPNPHLVALERTNQELSRVLGSGFSKITVDQMRGHEDSASGGLALRLLGAFSDSLVADPAIMVPHENHGNRLSRLSQGWDKNLQELQKKFQARKTLEERVPDPAHRMEMGVDKADVILNGQVYNRLAADPSFWKTLQRPQGVIPSWKNIVYS